MNLINQHFDKNNLHHAYLIEGAREEVIPEILKFIEILGINIVGNPDFYHTTIDSLKIDDALSLRKMGSEKAFTSGKKIFIININSFTFDAQGVLLKMFEEPIENTHFFIITPNINFLQKTLISRFYLIKSKDKLENEIKQANNFIKMSKRDRIDFLKELLAKKDEDEYSEVDLNSVYFRAFKFINALEVVLHQKVFSEKYEGKVDFFDQFFKVRKFISQPGSSIKTLMESVALIVPNF
ncbi:MAG: hypothetical protein WC264_00660 [Candidatus Paceibacterota bacterium]|jgi:hypothetical protein